MGKTYKDGGHGDYRHADKETKYKSRKSKRASKRKAISYKGKDF